MLHWFDEKTDAPLEVTADFHWPPTATWIQVVTPTTAELDFVAKHLQVPDYLFQDVSDEDERPRLEREGDIALIILKVPAPMQADAELRFRTLPVGLWLLPHQMVTASAQPWRFGMNCADNASGARHCTYGGCWRRFFRPSPGTICAPCASSTPKSPPPKKYCATPRITTSFSAPRP